MLATLGTLRVKLTLVYGTEKLKTRSVFVTNIEDIEKCTLYSGDII